MNNTFGWLLGPYPTSPGSGSPAGGGGPGLRLGNGRATGTYQQGPGGSLGGPQPSGPPGGAAGPLTSPQAALKMSMSGSVRLWGGCAVPAGPQ